MVRSGRDLELVGEQPRGGRQNVDILLVHGMSAGAWMWQEGALKHFADVGYRSWALSLSGHGNSADSAALPWAPLEHYSTDLSEALDHIARPTVVIAHSLGGAVVQNLLRRGRRIPGTVLLCSVPPYGLWRASMEMFFRNPELWRTLAEFAVMGWNDQRLAVMRRHLFPNGIDDALFAKLVACAQDESFFAMHAATGWRPLAPPPLSQQRMLVIGGALDSLVPATDVQLTAIYYGVKPHVIDNAGHMMMFEPEGLIAADIVLRWITGLDAEHC